MERTTRMLGLWGALAWGILGTGVWASNGVHAVISDAEPSLDALLFALALTMTGVTIGITFGVVAGLIRQGRHPDNTTAEGQLSWMPPMGVGLLGLVTTPLFNGSPLSTMDWVLLAAGALTGGFIVGIAPRMRPRRLPSTESAVAGPGAERPHLGAWRERGW